MAYDESDTRVRIGTHVAVMGVAAFVLIGCRGAQGAGPANRRDLLRVEQEYREAKLKGDTATLGRLLAPEYHGINQNGHARDRKAVLELYRRFKVGALTPRTERVTISNGVAVVSGVEAERTACGDDELTFMRVYSKTDGNWRLLSSLQTREPPRDRAVMSAKTPDGKRCEPSPGSSSAVTKRQ